MPNVVIGWPRSDDTRLIVVTTEKVQRSGKSAKMKLFVDLQQTWLAQNATMTRKAETPRFSSSF